MFPKDDPNKAAMYLLIGAMTAIYIAVRALTDAIAGSPRPQPGRRAIAQWSFVAILCVFATLRAQPQVALGVIFSTSISALSLVWGIVTFQSPTFTPPRWRRTWPFVLPAAVLPLLAGFSGHLTLMHAGLFALEGVVIAMLWRDRSIPDGDDSIGLADIAPQSSEHVSRFKIAQAILALALGGIGAWAAVDGTIQIGTSSRVLTPGLIAATILGPMIMLPMIGTGSLLAHRGETWTATSSQVGLVLLNLCLLLPMVIALWSARDVMSPWLAKIDPPKRVATQPANVSDDLEDEPVEAPPPKMFPYPLAVWRVDTVVLIVLGMMLVPVGLGRWDLGRIEALALIVAYATYLAMATLLGSRL